MGSKKKKRQEEKLEKRKKFWRSQFQMLLTDPDMEPELLNDKQKKEIDEWLKKIEKGIFPQPE